MKTLALLGLCSLLMAANVVAADDLPLRRGDQMLWECTRRGSDVEVEQMLGIAWCAAYISGMVDATRILGDVNPDGRLICYPQEGISNDQAMRIVVKWLEDHPQSLHESARMSTMIALADAFPCE